jgi:hypothetical protein
MRLAIRLIGALALAAVFPCGLCAGNRVDRVIIIKVDGLPADFIQRLTHDDQTKLPSIRSVFGRNGATLENFYVRGLSLSAPSWSLLDTGRHLEIRGNVEYDRYTLRPYDYLNFFPFYLAYSFSKRADKLGVEMLDELGIPLLSDRFPSGTRFQGPQLLQRSASLGQLSSTLKRALMDKPPKQVFDEWQTGLSWMDSWERETERELMVDLKDPKIRYLDYFAAGYDHGAHLTPDRITQLHTVESLDALVGRVSAAIAASPYPATTALIMVSDHGMNSVDGIYSQGYSLVDWFAGAEGGGHHVLTNRHPMTEFKLKGLDPFVAEVVTPSTAPAYLGGQSALYPTVMLDLDGNERASIGLRNNTLNKLHVLLDQIIRKRLRGPLRSAALRAFFSVLDGVRTKWQQDLDDLQEELHALDIRIGEQQALVDAQPKKKWTQAEKERGLDKDARRVRARLEDWKTQRREYDEYANIVRRLLRLEPSDFDPGRFKIEHLIPPHSLGPLNSPEDLRHYVTGPAPGGLAVAPGGTLDMARSFREIDYFEELSKLRVRNNVQRDVGSRPVDFIAVRVPQPEGEAILLWRGEDRQALLRVRRNGKGDLELHYEPRGWAPGYPLELFEDPNLGVPRATREQWLQEWHTEREWLEATHRTRYSNGIVGLAEELLDLDPPPVDTAMQRYLQRKRHLRRTDLLVFASDHWNFNVRGFNPGGNHGSFLRTSTHSTFLIAGGKETGLPRGVKIAAPYDSLSFTPTVLALMGLDDPKLPGPVIRELTGGLSGTEVTRPDPAPPNGSAKSSAIIGR